MKKQYIAPNIERNSAGNINKYGAKSVVRHQESIDGIAIKDLVSQFGSPLLVFSESQLRKKYRRMQDIMQMHYPHLQQAWSYKNQLSGRHLQHLSSGRFLGRSGFRNGI
jgi:diaminopimelate decarboxylase